MSVREVIITLESTVFGLVWFVTRRHSAWRQELNEGLECRLHSLHPRFHFRRGRLVVRKRPRRGHWVVRWVVDLASNPHIFESAGSPVADAPLTRFTT